MEFLVVRGVPHADRGRHRRGIRRGERHDPGTDPGAAARLYRPGGERQLLAGCGDRRAGGLCGARPGDHAAGDRLAGGLYHRRCTGFRGAAAAALPAGKPALADDARPAGGSRTHCRGNRGSGGARNRQAVAAGAARVPDVADRCAFLVPGRGGGAGHDLSAAGLARGDADGGSGVLLQRGVLHLCAGSDAVLRDFVRQCRAVHVAVRDRQLPWAAGARATVRYRRAADHDHRDLRACPGC